MSQHPIDFWANVNWGEILKEERRAKEATGAHATKKEPPEGGSVALNGEGKDFPA